jgi:hypothetical protein
MEHLNDTHRSYPRTLQEALGPYASGPLHPLPAPSNRLAIPAYLVALVIVIALLLVLL